MVHRVKCIMAQKVRDLALMDTGFGTAPDTDKANLIWEEANSRMNEEISEFAKRVPASESYVRKVLKQLPPTAF